ncbi:MAG: hypothetical protein NTY48_03735 [Candidatus Diapherotrites archaeon]|nr:hypothetical protein [Candidatus Diapherotrites archaeon]
MASGAKDPLHLRPAKVREALMVLLGMPNGVASEYLNEKFS